MDFNNWLHEMDQFFEQVGLSDNKKVGFPKMKLIGRALNYRNDIENHHYGLYKPVINDWNKPSVAQFKKKKNKKQKNKISVHAISNHNLTPMNSTMKLTLESQAKVFF